MIGNCEMVLCGAGKLDDDGVGLLKSTEKLDNVKQGSTFILFFFDLFFGQYFYFGFSEYMTSFLRV